MDISEYHARRNKVVWNISLKKAIKASTTGKAKRAVKKAVNPLYGKKGVGLAKNPKRAVKNAVYKKTTVGVKDLLK